MNLFEVFKSTVGNINDNLFVAKIGKITSVNPSKDGFTVDLEVMQSRRKSTLSNTSVQLPKLSSVPVLFNYGSAGGVDVPLKAGDSVVILFFDSDVSNFFKGIPITNRPENIGKHSMNNCIAIPFVKTKVQSSTHSQDKVRVFSEDGASVELTEFVSIKNKAENLSTILSDLITALTSLRVDIPAGTVDPVTVTALEAISTRIKALLT